jgi:IS5 family transposase
MKKILRAYVLKHQLLQYAELTKRVIDQTQRRVLQGEQVPAPEKIVSIFETRTDIIVKDRRETLYGHKICLTSGASGIITDVVVEQGNPSAYVFGSVLACNLLTIARHLLGPPSK